MPTDPNPSLAPHSPSASLPSEIAQALAAGLDHFSRRELLALILNSLGQAERQAYLAGAPTDKGNGAYARSLKMGSILIERGLRRVLLVVHDDFSGLLPLTKGLFPQADVQLCIVHLQRNAKSHLAKPEAAEFNQRIRTLKAAWNAEVAALQFEDLCQRFESRSPTFIREIRKKRDHYLAFLNYPDSIRRSLSTTNVVEAVNGQLEILRRNSGGYFHSEDTLKLKLGLAVSQLETGRWRRVAASVQNALDQFNILFQSRFESEESLCFQTQNS